MFNSIQQFETAGGGAEYMAVRRETVKASGCLLCFRDLAVWNHAELVVTCVKRNFYLNHCKNDRIRVDKIDVINYITFMKRKRMPEGSVWDAEKRRKCKKSVSERNPRKKKMAAVHRVKKASGLPTPASAAGSVCGIARSSALRRGHHS